LADVIQNIGEGALEEFFGRCMKLPGASKVVIKALEGIEKALNFVGPRQGRRIMPSLLTFGHAEAPVEKIADVRKDLERGAAILACLEIDVALWSIADDFASAIGNRGQRMAEEVSRADLFMRHTGLS